MNLASGAQNFISDVNKRFADLLNKAFYPVERLSDRWIQVTNRALRHASIIQLGVEPQKLRALYEYTKGAPMTLADFATLSNNLQNRSAIELGIFPPDYADLMQEVDENVTVWNEIAQKLRDDLEKELQEETAVRQKLAETQKTGGLRAEA